jgi:polysaccharide biosynthesis protein PslH
VLKHLAQKHKVTLICTGSPQDVLAEELTQTCSSIHLVKPAPKAKGWKLYVRIFLGLFSPLPFAVKSRFSLAYQAKVAEILNGERIDLIACDSLYQAAYVPLKKYKTLLNEHNIESTIIDRYVQLETNPVLKGYAFYELNRMKRYENRIWRSFDILLVCSEVDKKEVDQRALSQLVQVIPNGVNLPGTGEQQEEANLLVYTGLISWKPNEDAVLFFAKEIYPLIKRANSHARWMIVGKSPSKQVRQLQEQDPSIEVTGFVDDISTYTAKGSVVIVPLRIGSGTRLKILEALALKKAVVSTSVGCEGLDVTDGIDIRIADEPKQFAKCVVSLLKDEDKRRKLGAAGRLLVEQKYSFEVIGKKIEKVISLL